MANFIYNFSKSAFNTGCANVWIGELENLNTHNTHFNKLFPKSMITYTNDIGCKMSFDEGISKEQIEMRLKIFGDITKWREVKDEKA